MAYNIKQTNDSQKIAEQEYAHDDTIKFTKFTSCIGIIVRTSWTLTAVHLVIVGHEDSPFDKQAVDTVKGILGDYDEALMIGHIDIWDDNLKETMKYLRDQIKKLKEVQLEDGNYGAKVNDGGNIEWYSY